MVEDPAESVQPNVAFSNIRMTVEAGVESAFAVVGVDERDAGEPEDGGDLGEGCAEAGIGGDVEAGGVEVAGVEAKAGGEGEAGGGEAVELAEFFEGAADGGAGAGGVFKQEGEVGDAQAFGGGFEGSGEGVEGGFEGGVIFGGAGVHDEVVGSDGGGAQELAAEGGDAFGADGGVGGGEVNEVAIVDDKGGEAVCGAVGAQFGAAFRRGHGGAPHPGAGGEDLKAIGAEFDGLDGRVDERAGRGGVNSDSHDFSG